MSVCRVVKFAGFVGMVCCGLSMVAQAAGSESAVAATEDTMQEQRPNIVYIALEDIAPMMGCYGDTYARTPGVRQTR
jgi:hypothetical protein